MMPRTIAQNTPQTTIKTTPRTINSGSDIFGFFLVASAGAEGLAVGFISPPLKEKVLPSLIGLAGVLVRACSALVPREGLSGAADIPGGGASG